MALCPVVLTPDLILRWYFLIVVVVGLKLYFFIVDKFSRSLVVFVVISSFVFLRCSLFKVDMPRRRLRRSPARPATAPHSDPSPSAALAAPVAVDPSSLVAPTVPSSSIHAHTDVALSRSSSSSSGSSATIHLEPHCSATAVANAIALVSRLGFVVVPAASVVPAGSAVPVSPPRSTGTLHDAVSLPRVAHDILLVTSDAVVNRASQPLPSMPGQHSRLPAPPVPPPRSQLPSSIVAAASTDWDAADRDTVLRASSRPRFTEASGMKTRAFLDDSELFLQLYGRPRARWGLFVMSWLGFAESNKVRRSHIADDVAEYDKFREGLLTLFGRHEFQDSFRGQLRSLRQSGSEAVADFPVRVTDLCSRAYSKFFTEDQLDLAVSHFISGLADVTSREFLRRERARQNINWQEAVQMAQASEPLHALDPVAASAQHCSPGTSIAGNAVASSHFENNFAPDGVASTSVAVNSSGAYEGFHPAGNTSTCARTSTDHPRAKSHSARVPMQCGNAVRQAAAPPSCYNCGASDHLVRAYPMNLGCSVVCYTCGGAGHMSRVCPSRPDRLCTIENVAPTPIVLNASPGVEEPGGAKLNARSRQSCQPEVYVPPD